MYATFPAQKPAAIPFHLPAPMTPPTDALIPSPAPSKKAHLMLMPSSRKFTPSNQLWLLQLYLILCLCHFLLGFLISQLNSSLVLRFPSYSIQVLAWISSLSPSSFGFSISRFLLTLLLTMVMIPIIHLLLSTFVASHLLQTISMSLMSLVILPSCYPDHLSPYVARWLPYLSPFISLIQWLP